jgi:hypothetical protein
MLKLVKGKSWEIWGSYGGEDNGVVLLGWVVFLRDVGICVRVYTALKIIVKGKNYSLLSVVR